MTYNPETVACYLAAAVKDISVNPVRVYVDGGGNDGFPWIALARADTREREEQLIESGDGGILYGGVPWVGFGKTPDDAVVDLMMKVEEEERREESTL